MRFSLYILVCLGVCAVAQADGFSVFLEHPVTPYHRPSELRIVYTGEPGTLLDVRELETALKALEQAEVVRRELESQPLPDGRLRQGVAFRLDALAPGTHVLPAAQVRAGETAFQLPRLVWQARELTQVELDAVGVFKAIVLPEPRPLSQATRVWWYALLGALVLLALALVWWLRRTKPDVFVPAPPAWETAHRRLKELLSRRLPEQGKHERYYVDLSAILRYYIEERFGVHAPEQTTPEFLEAASGTLAENHKATLAEFLRHCDRVKFARYEPSMDEMKRSFDIVKGFVEHTTPRVTVEHETAGGGEAAA